MENLEFVNDVVVTELTENGGEVVETVIETVVEKPSTIIKLAKGGVVVVVVAAAGYGIYKLAKHLKAKKDDKIIYEQKEEIQVEEKVEEE